MESVVDKAISEALKIFFQTKFFTWNVENTVIQSLYNLLLFDTFTKFVSK